MIIFIDAEITANFINYGDGKEKLININGLFQFDESDLLNFDEKIIERFGKIEYDGHNYEAKDIRYSVKYKSVNRVLKMNKKDKSHNMASCMLSILDSLKLHDKCQLEDDETLSEMMFRKMKAYNIDLNKELGFTHLKPVKKNEAKN